MRAAFASLTPGIEEREVAEAAAISFGSNDAFLESVSVCFGESGTFPHHRSGARVLRPDDCVLIGVAATGSISARISLRSRRVSR